MSQIGEHPSVYSESEKAMHSNKWSKDTAGPGEHTDEVNFSG